MYTDHAYAKAEISKHVDYDAMRVPPYLTLPPDHRHRRRVVLSVVSPSFSGEQTDAPKSQRYKLGMCVLAQVKLAKSGWGEDGEDGEDGGKDANDEANDNSSDSGGFHFLEAVNH